MKSLALAAAVAVTATTIVGNANAASNCDTYQLPDIVCETEPTPPLPPNISSSDCCVDLDKDADNRLDDKRQCSQAFYWKMVDDTLDANVIRQHNLSQNIRTATFTEYPQATSAGGSTWARHFVSNLLLSGVRYVPGKSWHDSVHDYTQSVRGNGSPYHGAYATVQVERIEDVAPGDYASAEMASFVFDTNQMRLSCDHFIDSPVKQAAILMHESWHLFYGGHDGDGSDFFYRRAKGVLQPGQMGDRFVSVERHDDSDTIVQNAVESVLQTQLYFFCDIITTPTDWISNRTIAQARNAHYETIGRLNIPTGSSVPDLCVGDFCVPGFSCATSFRLDRPGGQQFPQQPPRFLNVRVDGLMNDETPAVGEDSQKLIHLDLRGLELIRGGSFAQSPLIRTGRSDDDTRFDFAAEARLLEDGETVEVRYQGAFYEDPPDCELDTSPESQAVEGVQCMGLQGPSHWKVVTLNSEERFKSIPHDLNNHWNEGDNDWARFTVELSLDY